MRILFILTFIGLSFFGNAQRGTKDFQIEIDTPVNALYLMSNDTVSSSPTYKFGDWKRLYEGYGIDINTDSARTITFGVDTSEISTPYDVLIAGDADWYKTGGAKPDDITQDIYHTGDIHVGDNTMAGGGRLNVLGRIDQRFPTLSLNNIMIGQNAGNTSATGDNNVGIGANSLAAFTTGAGNFGLGAGALQQLTTGAQNVAIGSDAAQFGNPSAGTYIGYQAGRTTGGLAGVTAVGYLAGTAGGGNFSTLIGRGAGAAATGQRNTLLGAFAGYDVTTGESNVMIGYEGAGLGNVSNRLVITNTTDATPLIYGEFDNNLIKINGKLGYITEGGTATTLAGRDASEYFSNVSIGYGLDLTSGTLEADTSELATQYDITLATGGTMMHWFVRAEDTAGESEIIDSDTLTILDQGLISVTRSNDTITISGVEVDGSTTNEAWTIDADDADTEVISNQTVKYEGDFGIITDYDAAGNILNIEADTSQLATQYDITLATGGTMMHFFIRAEDTAGQDEIIDADTVTFMDGGIISVTRTNDTILVTGTEVDGSISNELQTIANTSDGTSHTVTLSNSGGSVQLIEGTGITLTTGGTGSAGTVTIASTVVADHDWYESGDTPPNAIADEMYHTGDIHIGYSAMSAPAKLNVLSTTEQQRWLYDADTYLSVTVGSAGLVTFNIDDPLTGEVFSFSDKVFITGSGADATGVVGTDGSGLITDVPLSGMSLVSGTLTATDGSVSNEGVLGVGGGAASSSTLLSTTSGANAVTINVAGILSISESTSANGGSITITGTEVDGSTSNELNTIEVENVSVQASNTNIDFQTLFDVATDGAGEVNVSLDLGEASTVTTPEADDYIIMYDLGSTAAQKILYSDIADLLGGGSADGNGIYSGDGTVPTGTTATLADGTFEFVGATASIRLEDTGTSPSFNLAANIADADANYGTIGFYYTDTDYAGGAEQIGYTINANRETDDLLHSTLIFSSNQSSVVDVLSIERFESLSANTMDTYTQINSGVAYSQYYESATTANPITLDRGYYNVALTTGHTGTITLPEISTAFENYSEIAAGTVSVGQEYVISNFSGSAVTIAVINNTGSLNDDHLNGVENGTLSLADGKSIIVKAVALVSSEGRWATWSND
jgi:hypothetical protein